jgi:hypothetical protein
MPLIKNKEELDQWIKDNEGKHLYKGLPDPSVYIQEGEPESFPCWLAAVKDNPDCGRQTISCEFIYQDADKNWDLQRYEDEIGWG